MQFWIFQISVENLHIPRSSELELSHKFREK